MKLILISLILVLTSASVNQNNHNCQMLYNADSKTFEVWQNNQLLLEFNARNTDSASLETLDYIISTLNEFK